MAQPSAWFSQVRRSDGTGLAGSAASSVTEGHKRGGRRRKSALVTRHWRHTGGTLRARKRQLPTITENKASPGKAGYNCVSALYGIADS